MNLLLTRCDVTQSFHLFSLKCLISSELFQSLNKMETGKMAGELKGAMQINILYCFLLWYIIYPNVRVSLNSTYQINNPLKRAGFHIWKLFLLCYKAVYNRAFEPGNQVKSWWQNNTINTFLVFFVSYTAFKGLKQQLDGVWVNRDVQKQIHRNFYFITFIFISAVSLFFLLEAEAAGGGGSQLPRFGEESCGGV